MNPRESDSPQSALGLEFGKPGVAPLTAVDLPPLPTKTILVTGGSGFIGGQLVIDLANYYSSQPEPYRYDHGVYVI